MCSMALLFASFISFGVMVSVILGRAEERVGTLYFADLVGAGGIGNLLFTQYRFFNWSNVSVIVIELFALVVIIEFISIGLRRRLV